MSPTVLIAHLFCIKPMLGVHLVLIATLTGRHLSHLRHNLMVERQEAAT